MSSCKVVVNKYDLIIIVVVVLILLIINIMIILIIIIIFEAVVVIVVIGVNPEGLGGRDPQILGWGRGV